MKTQMLAVLGEGGLALPAQIDAGLAANDRLKYYFTLLQGARGHADRPDDPTSSLKQERLAAGIGDPELDLLVTDARREGASYRVKGCGRLMTAIAEDAHMMAAPVELSIAPRLKGLLDNLPNAADDLINSGEIDGITRADRDRGDSLHLLVMEMHKKLNALQAGLAKEHIEGAAAYRLGEGDASLVRAFMVGLNRTASLKFGHPGLATTATRVETKLIIQNDIGTTDAHVIVIHVEGAKVSLTYSDVHLERLQFFRALFEKFAVLWSDPSSSQVPTLAGGAPFYLSTGIFEAKDREALLAYLDHLGSRLVFLIDWNRARKQLRGFLRAEQRLRLLRWAADADIGHRGFLELGGAKLLWGALETSAATAIHLGDRLCDVLGEDSAFAFVQFAFKTAAEGLIARRSDGLIKDRIRAELLNHLNTADARLFGIAIDHAGFIFEIAASIRDHVFGPRGDAPESGKWEKRTKRWEHEADQCVVAIATSVRRRPELEPFYGLIRAADDAADGLEEVAFLLGLLDIAVHARARELLQPLAGILVDTSQEWIKALTDAQHVRRHGLRDDNTDDFLTAIDRVALLEHDADHAERALALAALKKAEDFRELHVLSEIRRGLGEASDALKRASLLLRNHVIGDVLAT